MGQRKLKQASGGCEIVHLSELGRARFAFPPIRQTADGAIHPHSAEALLSQNGESPFLSHSARGLCITAVHHAAHRDGGGGGVPGPLRIEAVTRTCGGGKSSLARMTPRQSEVDGPRPVSGGGGGATCALVAAAPTAVTRPGLHQHHVRLVARRRRPPRAEGRNIRIRRRETFRVL